MGKIFIAVLLASGAAASPVAAQPAQNVENPRPSGTHHGHQGAAAVQRPSNAGGPGGQHGQRGRSGPSGAPLANPGAHSRVRTENVQQRREVIMPPAGHGQVSPLPNRSAVDQRGQGAVHRGQPRMENRPVAHPGQEVTMPPAGHRQARPAPNRSAVDQRGQTRIHSAEPRMENRQGAHRVSPMPNVERRRAPEISHIPRMGTQPPLRSGEHASPRAHWNTNWRYNQRYDWKDWRRTHGSVYHVRPYRDPYNWAYQLFTIGWRLWPYYYSSGYWIEDPWMYRLPPAPPGTRWVRYYNDALLVDTWTGEVIDVVHDVFW